MPGFALPIFDHHLIGHFWLAGPGYPMLVEILRPVITLPPTDFLSNGLECLAAAVVPWVSNSCLLPDH